MPGKPSDPCPREIRGSDLTAGMQTYYRVVDHEGEVKFKPDLWLIEELDNTGCRNSRHFRGEREGKHVGTVCYWNGGRVWVKDVKYGQPKKTRRDTGTHNLSTSLADPT